MHSEGTEDATEGATEGPSGHGGTRKVPTRGANTLKDQLGAVAGLSSCRVAAGMASVEDSVLAALSSPRPSQQQNITLAASTGQYSDAVIRVGDQYQVLNVRTSNLRTAGCCAWC